MGIEEQIKALAAGVDRPTKLRRFDDDEVEFLKESVTAIWKALALIGRSLDAKNIP